MPLIFSKNFATGAAVGTFTQLTSTVSTSAFVTFIPSAAVVFRTSQTAADGNEVTIAANVRCELYNHDVSKLWFGPAAAAAVTISCWASA